MLEVDPNLKECVWISQGIEEMLPTSQLYNKRPRAIQSTCDNF